MKPRWEKKFWRCEASNELGRQCWKAPGHIGPHLILPRGHVPDGAVRRVFEARPDVDAAVLGPAIILEALKVDR
tara:strand:+ start:898 stop:1119 length:222 start_codon:yes stop_codon:yes gene_type:complete